MFLVVGLGNPGREYENTPHNIGFKVIDALASRQGVSSFRSRFQSEYHQGDACILQKPLTFMNLSGRAVQGISSFFKIPPEQILVVTDDIDLPEGQLRLRLKGSGGGHNGLKSIIEVLGQDFPRLRIGVGRKGDAAEHVLGNKSKKWFEAIVPEAADAVELILKEGVAKAMNTVNRKKDSDVT